MGLLDRIRGGREDGPKVQGRLGYFNLGEWWLTSFTEEERHHIEQTHKPMGQSQDSLTQGNETNSGTAAGFLVSLSSWFMGTGDRYLAIRMLEKADNFTGSGVLDRHFVYGQMIKVYYAEREMQSGAFDAAVAACERQIAIGSQAWAAFVAEPEERAHSLAARTGLKIEAAVFMAPSHRGFVQLAIIREKQGDFTEALRLCREASSQGWRDGKGDWSKRIARLESRMNKTG